MAKISWLPVLAYVMTIAVPLRARADQFVYVTIDKTAQTITIRAPETAGLPGGEYVALVSTGGGWKHPVDPVTRQKDKPYCADDVTPNVRNMWIPAIDGQTMFYSKISNRFEVAMDRAILVKDGIYLHQVIAGLEGGLGDNVSGGCVRLDSEVAPWLFEEMTIYGGIFLTIKGEPRKRKCSPAAQTGQRSLFPILNWFGW